MTLQFVLFNSLVAEVLDDISDLRKVDVIVIKERAQFDKRRFKGALRRPHNKEGIDFGQLKNERPLKRRSARDVFPARV